MAKGNLRRKLLGKTRKGRIVRAAALAGVLGGGGYLASRRRTPGSSTFDSQVSAPELLSSAKSTPARKPKSYYQRVQATNKRLAKPLNKAVIHHINKEDSGRWGLAARAGKKIRSAKDAVEVPKYRTQLEANRLKRNAAEKRLQSLPKAKPRGQRVRRGSTTPRRPPRRPR